MRTPLLCLAFTSSHKHIYTILLAFSAACSLKFDDDARGTGDGGGALGSGDQAGRPRGPTTAAASSEPEWFFLCPGAVEEQQRWRGKVNDAIFNAQHAAAYVGSGVLGAVPDAKGERSSAGGGRAGFDLGFLGPSVRGRLPSIESAGGRSRNASFANSEGRRSFEGSDHSASPGPKGTPEKRAGGNEARLRLGSDLRPRANSADSVSGLGEHGEFRTSAVLNSPFRESGGRPSGL